MVEEVRVLFQVFSAHPYSVRSFRRDESGGYDAMSVYTMVGPAPAAPTQPLPTASPTTKPIPTVPGSDELRGAHVEWIFWVRKTVYQGRLA